MKMLRVILLSSALLLAWWTVYAHDLWIEKEHGTLILYYGHKHSGHEGPEFMQYSPKILVGARCFNEKGEKTILNIPERYPLTVTKSCAVTYVITSTGYWTKTPYGTKNIPKNESEQAVKSWLSYESVKRIDAWNENLAKPLTDDLELVPLSNPFKTKKGDKLRLLVTYKRKPVKGVFVSYMGKPRGTTDDNGKINVRLKQGGFQIIQASYHIPLKSEKADETIYTTNLNFELKEDE